MSAETFLDGRVTLHSGDARDVMKQLASCSVDSIVTDPPYALVSISKRFGKDGAAPAKKGKTGAYARASAGFMGAKWDTGDTAFASEFWAEVLRVLKPGGHLVAFSGTRTYHRMACAIEDSGFEIRDQIGWCYGSGFPKSHDVSKGIDKRKNWSALPKLQTAIRTARTELGISQSEAARRMGLIGQDEELGGGGFMWFETGMRAPTREQWPALKSALKIGDDFDLCFEEAEREITGDVEEWVDRTNYAITSKDGHRRDKPASELAIQWAGWGTALKPAWEPIVLARKPLSEKTVAANVQKWGTGALNIDGCRVKTDECLNGGAYAQVGARSESQSLHGGTGMNVAGKTVGAQFKQPPGRWPANIITDGSEEVAAAFPDSAGQQGIVRGTEPSECHNGVYSGPRKREGFEYSPRDDEGSAARFFYAAKADTDDRLGSKHPTVKPLDLMQYLVRLVTPPNGLVLDCFAGTGTTGEAAYREGHRAILIEAEPEYQADIRRRCSLILSGPGERGRESIKARGLTADAGPLFADNYDPQQDFSASLDVGYAAIRERVANGGPGWEPK